MSTAAELFCAHHPPRMTPTDALPLPGRRHLTLVKALPQARNHSGRVMRGCIQETKVKTNH
jgi:hypothetical protein